MRVIDLDMPCPKNRFIRVENMDGRSVLYLPWSSFIAISASNYLDHRTRSPSMTF